MSAIISSEEVKRIATLARLGISDEEADRSAKDLGGILEYFSQIQKIDTQNVPMSDDITGLKNITREDTANPDDLCPTDVLLANVPETKDGQIRVKAVFE